MLKKLCMTFAVLAAIVALGIILGVQADACYPDDFHNMTDHIDVSENIEARKAVQDKVHELANCARRFGYAESSPCIQYCKKIWDDANEEIKQFQALSAYTYEDIMCFTNVVFGESGLTGIDSLMQETALIAKNHLDMGLKNTIKELLCMTLPSGYYVWYPPYSTIEYANQQMALHPQEYQRAHENVIIALSGAMEYEVPSNVIYADTQPHGSAIWKTYSVNTGYYLSTVYLCFA